VGRLKKNLKDLIEVCSLQSSSTVHVRLYKYTVGRFIIEIVLNLLLYAF
jgi:hypothetical protein